MTARPNFLFDCRNSSSSMRRSSRERTIRFSSKASLCVRFLTSPHRLLRLPIGLRSYYCRTSYVLNVKVGQLPALNVRGPRAFCTATIARPRLITKPILLCSKLD